MKIFNKEDFKSKSFWNYENTESPEVDGIKPMCTTEKEIDMRKVLIINDVAYAVCGMCYKDNTKLSCLVKKLENQEVFVEGKDPEDEDYTNNIICPFCGYENLDSWEKPDGEETNECENCGSIFSYRQNVTIEYCSQPVRKADVVVI